MKQVIACGDAFVGKLRGSCLSQRYLALLATTALLLGAVTGCGGSAADGVGIQGVNQSAPRLEDRDENGNYSPYFASGDMQRPRYMHRAVLTQDNLVFIFGGSDERGLTALDSIEFYDQARVQKDEVVPETGTGAWFDTNFEGDPMNFQTGPRILFSADILANGAVILIGGTTNLLAGEVRDRAEIFDPSTRTMDSLEDEMIQPRFRHTTTVLNNGSLMILGGQYNTTVTSVDQQDFLGPIQTSTEVFPSTPSIEIYSPTENSFTPFRAENSRRDVTLVTPRGRSGHTVGRMAGPDQSLGSANDVFLVVGGIQTLSSQFAPDNKLPGRAGAGEADALKSLEFFDPQTKVFVQVSNVGLDNGRVDDPAVMNLGRFNNLTPDGMEGMSNVVLITHGNTDGGCPTTAPNVFNKVLTASFTGFGPAQGIQFFQIQDLENLPHYEGTEYVTDLGPIVPPPWAALMVPIERALTTPVALPRRMLTVEGVPDLGTWVVAVSGAHITPLCAYIHNIDFEVVGAGCVFDPFYSLRALRLGISPRDLLSSRTNFNPTGVVGTWLILDGEIPLVDNAGLGTTDPTQWAHSVASARVYAANLALPGEDGLINTPDDRIFQAGGGSNGANLGDEPTTPSSEVLVMPGSASKEPVP